MDEYSNTPPRKSGRKSTDPGNIVTVPIFRRMPVGSMEVAEHGEVPFEVGALQEMANIVRTAYDGPSMNVHNGTVHDVLMVEHEGRKVTVLLNDGHPDA